MTLLFSSFLLLIAFRQEGATTFQCVFVRPLIVNLILRALKVLVGKLDIYLELILSF